MWILLPPGPVQRTKRSGSVCARISCTGVAVKSRVVQMIAAPQLSPRKSTSSWLYWAAASMLGIVPAPSSST